MKGKEERLIERRKILDEGVRFTDPWPILEDNFSRLLDTYTKEELLDELVECGLELTPEEEKHWIEPVIIDTEEEAEMLINGLERAAAAPHKDIDVDYKEVTDAIEIRKMFGVDNNEKDN